MMSMGAGELIDRLFPSVLAVEPGKDSLAPLELSVRKCVADLDEWRKDAHHR